ncbi:MAG: type II secretion system major pseudopilin GspG [Bdellovibrionales bacterium]|nr:type II secretion system major pseudopilin GspG [Bdellovibrionales bacterium]
MNLKSLTLRLIGRRQRPKSRAGFTLLEILAVLGLLGIVISIVAPKIFGSLGRGKVSATKLQIKQLEGNLDRYRLDCGFYPTGEQGLQALISQPSGGRTCTNYDPEGYLGGAKAVPKDPFGSDFKYSCDDGIHFKICSLGADGAEGGDGNNKDICSGED